MKLYSFNLRYKANMADVILERPLKELPKAANQVGIGSNAVQRNKQKVNCVTHEPQALFLFFKRFKNPVL